MKLPAHQPLDTQSRLPGLRQKEPAIAACLTAKQVSRLVRFSPSTGIARVRSEDHVADTIEEFADFTSFHRAELTASRGVWERGRWPRSPAEPLQACALPKP
jgi:hypothetical protein